MTVVVWVLGYLFAAVVAARIAAAGTDDGEWIFLAGLLWPLGVAFYVVAAVVWLFWHALDLPAYAIKRLAERRTLREARHAERLREAEAILREEGLDFTP